MWSHRKNTRIMPRARRKQQQGSSASSRIKPPTASRASSSSAAYSSSGAWKLLRAPLMYAAVAVLAFAIMSSTAFWEASFSAGRKMSTTLSSGIGAVWFPAMQASAQVEHFWVEATAKVSNTLDTFYARFSYSQGQDLDGTMPSSEATDTANSASVPFSSSKDKMGATSSDDSELNTDTASGKKTSLETAVAKLEQMLVAIDTNKSFVTNKTRSPSTGPKRDDVLNELGVVLLKKGEKVAALAKWREAVQGNPAAFRARLNLGQALYKGSVEGSKEREEAKKVLGDILELQRKCEPHKQVGKKDKVEAPAFCKDFGSKKNKDDVEDAIFTTHKLLGQIHLHAEKPLAAEAYLKQALKLRPWDQQMQLLLGGVYEELGMVGQAQAYYKQCSKLGSASGASVGMMKMMEDEKKLEKDGRVSSYGTACADRSRTLARKLAEWKHSKQSTKDIV